MHSDLKECSLHIPNEKSKSRLIVDEKARKSSHSILQIKHQSSSSIHKSNHGRISWINLHQESRGKDKPNISDSGGRVYHVWMWVECEDRHCWTPMLSNHKYELIGARLKSLNPNQGVFHLCENQLNLSLVLNQKSKWSFIQNDIPTTVC